jgi:disulfide bond formation protein DsbB
MAISTEPGSVRAATARGTSVWTWLALLVALAGLAGTLWLSMGMGLKACPLCLYQRTFVMGVVGVLGVGLLTGVGRAAPLSLLALPLAVGGLGVAGFHEYLVQVGRLECPLGVQGVGTAPQQSLAAFALLTVVLIIDALVSRAATGSVGLALVGGLVLGALFTVAEIKSAPPPAKATRPYELPVDQDGCRPPYRAPEPTAG